MDFVKIFTNCLRVENANDNVPQFFASLGPIHNN